jgi:hypothetical protein
MHTHHMQKYYYVSSIFYRDVLCWWHGKVTYIQARLGALPARFLARLDLECLVLTLSILCTAVLPRIILQWPLGVRNVSRLNPYAVRESYLVRGSYGGDEYKRRSRKVINKTCAYYIGLTPHLPSLHRTAIFFVPSQSYSNSPHKLFSHNA